MRAASLPRLRIMMMIEIRPPYLFAGLAKPTA